MAGMRLAPVLNPQHLCPQLYSAIKGKIAIKQDKIPVDADRHLAYIELIETTNEGSHTMTKRTDAQQDAINRMLNAPAGGWKVTGEYSGTLLGVKCEGVAVRIESIKLKMWGVVMPDGSMVKPAPGCKRISVGRIVWGL